MKKENLIPTKIANAARLAFDDLKQSTGENFYFFALVTHNGETPPFITAWSQEALDRFLNENGESKELEDEYRFAYAESPYTRHGKDFFREVDALWNELPSIYDDDISLERVDEIAEEKLSYMEEGIKTLDEQGYFGTGDARNRLVVTVMVAEEDFRNIPHAKRLNPSAALERYLSSWKEPKDYEDFEVSPHTNGDLFDLSEISDCLEKIITKNKKK